MATTTTNDLMATSYQRALAKIACAQCRSCVADWMDGIAGHVEPASAIKGNEQATAAIAVCLDIATGGHVCGL